MTIRRQALTTCGAPIMALLALTAFAAAQMTPTASPGAAWTEAVIYNFMYGTDGSWPHAGVVINKNGVLYGTTTDGGTVGAGTVFSLTPPASAGGAWTETILHDFTYGTDGSYPQAGVAIGKNGVLYGTTSSGGTVGAGTVFSLTPPASPGGAWTERVIYNFMYGTDGSHPYAGVTVGNNGVLYGTTSSGGTVGAGTVFALAPPETRDGAWTETVIYNFMYGTDGSWPYAGVVINKNGVLYGTTTDGGTVGAGTVFSLTPPASPGADWTETILHDFTYGTDGSYPQAGVVIGKNGVLYGTTTSGGTVGAGTVFSLTPPASPGGAWTERVIYNFMYGTDGSHPYAGVAISKNGVLYGTTTDGGSVGAGTIFSLTPPASPRGAWTETILHNFTYGTDDGSYPAAGVVIGRNGVLYGTTSSGGTVGAGTVFSMTP